MDRREDYDTSSSYVQLRIVIPLFSASSSVELLWNFHFSVEENYPEL